ncbi:MAG: hypothetical protein IKO05_04825 [Selenomonadaceae bacterium]|nr:hypothetical protein [Selenomonadaceae bacterium]
MTIVDFSFLNRSIRFIADDDRENYSIRGGLGNDTLSGADGNDTIQGGAGNDTLTGGDGSDVFIYESGDGNDTITDYDEDDIIRITSGTVKNISTTKAGNVVFKVGSGKITLKNAADKIITYEDADGVKNFYPIDFNAKRTSATLLSAYGKNEFDLADFDGLKNLDASAVTRGLEIFGNKLANKIIGGTSNDTLTGGKGSDVFIYKSSGGKDVITDYEEKDLLRIASGKIKSISTTKAGSVVFKVGSGKITLKNAANKIITYEDADGVKNFYPVALNAAGTAATLNSHFSNQSFTANGSLVSIDASKIARDLTIIGNAKANKIFGGAGDDIIYGEEGKDTVRGGDGDDEIFGGSGNDKLFGGEGSDSLWGDKGSDTLTGGADEDYFIYRAGDGKDTILDYEQGLDQIVVLGTDSRTRVESPIIDAAGNATLKIGSGQIVVAGAADKYVEVVDGSGNIINLFPVRREPRF